MALRAVWQLRGTGSRPPRVRVGVRRAPV